MGAPPLSAQPAPPQLTLQLDAFPHRWTADLRRTAPLIAPARQFVYPQSVPGEEDALGRGALYLQVRPETGGSFAGTCALGFGDPSLPSGLWACPRPDDLLVVAGGYAYRIDVTNPAHCEFLPMRPVASILVARTEGLLLLAGFNHVLALGAEGVRWATDRLSWEGVTMGEVRDGKLHGQGWDMFADREVPFTVDLQTGRHEGGGYRR